MEIIDKSKRSIFVGNISYGTTKGELLDILSTMGPVLSLKLVHDTDSGEHKGYGFCEFANAESAMSALRNLTDIKLNGRKLKIGNAYTEATRIEMLKLIQEPNEKRIYGPPCAPEDAPKIITDIVASMPPERLESITNEVKILFTENPEKARQLLKDNPQIGYALLQTHVAMGVISAEDAPKMLCSDRATACGERSVQSMQDLADGNPNRLRQHFRSVGRSIKEESMSANGLLSADNNNFFNDQNFTPRTLSMPPVLQHSLFPIQMPFIGDCVPPYEGNIGTQNWSLPQQVPPSGSQWNPRPRFQSQWAAKPKNPFNRKYK